MLKSVTINNLFNIQDLLDKLYSQHIEFDINTALKLLKIKKNVDECCKYVIERIYTAIPSLQDTCHKLDENETIIYNTILNSVIDIDNYGLTVEDLSKYKTVLLELRLTEFLDLLF